jgi:ribosome biogenesis protein SSF1/2
VKFFFFKKEKNNLMARKKKGKKTHVKAAVDMSIPRSFVIKSGQVSNSVVQLVRDIRRMLEPNTATHLKERKGNKIKDFLMVAGQLNVSHLLVFSKSVNGGVNLRMGKIPKGPTLTFHVEQYSLVKDILSIQQKPKSPGTEFMTAPLVVLNNFQKSEKHVVLMGTMLQNLFPAIRVSKMKLSEAKRVILFHLNPETNQIEVRHYVITIKTLGISKSIKSIINTQVPDLRGYDDISDFVMKGAFASESDIEDGPESMVTIPVKESSEKRAVKLVEMGPRLNLRLIKIESGFCGGEVLHHSYIKKTKEEEVQLKSRKEREAAEKVERRTEQERNVKAKEKLKETQDVAYDADDFDDLMEQDFEDADEGEGEDGDVMDQDAEYGE